MKKKSSIPAVGLDKVVLHLYVSGMTPKSMEAIENLKRICDQFLKDAFDLEIIDIYKNPELASVHHVLFSPSLVKTFPLPRKILVGTLAETEKVLKALGITSKKEE